MDRVADPYPVRSDPVFLPGSGSGFQISLDPDTDPVSVPGFWISSPDPMRKSVQNCSKSYLLGKTYNYKLRIVKNIKGNN